MRIRKLILRIVLVIVGVIGIAAVSVAALFSRLDETNGQLASSGVTRTYLLHVPPGYSPATAVPLVISLHGFAEWPAHLQQISGWSALADKSGFIVVYPSGTGFPRRWRAGGWGATAADMHADTAFIAELIDKLVHDYNIDRARIYVNGLSNGGGMSFVLGCALADRIAAVGGVAGAYALPVQECAQRRPVPMIVFHGTADPIVPYLGGQSGRAKALPNIPQWVAARAALNGCGSEPQTSPTVGAISAFHYVGCKQDRDVVFYSIRGGGHTWPGGEPLPVWLTGPTTTEINATQLMWEFFRRTSLAAP